jgi:hypothetical protein
MQEALDRAKRENPPTISEADVLGNGRRAYHSYYLQIPIISSQNIWLLHSTNREI